MSVTRDYLKAEAITRVPRHHFFGYYDKCPWDASGQLVLAMEVEFNDRLPDPEDMAVIGIVDSTDKNRFHPIANTHAWNWQQGAMVQWVQSAPDRLIIYNDRAGDQFVSVLLDIQRGERRLLPKPVTALSHSGRFALSVNYARLHHTRKGYGYAGVPDPFQDDPHPKDDGIYLMDLTTGKNRLIISLAQVAAFDGAVKKNSSKHWFNCLLFNPNDSRFCFLHRYRLKDGGTHTRLFTANPDGSDIYCLSDSGRVGHFYWRNPQDILSWAWRRKIIGLARRRNVFGHLPLRWILAWARRQDRGWIRQHVIGEQFFLFKDKTKDVKVIGKDILTEDGHCSYSPDGRWILIDTYPNEEAERLLILYSPLNNRRVDIGRFYSPPELGGDTRCDLHARWNRDGSKVCIDSAHEGTRQMYVLDVTKVVGEGR
ncbi:MAG: hypothetical protein ACFFCW_14865 [Candidatus Hodarchaeota archaeon]